MTQTEIISEEYRRWCNTEKMPVMHPQGQKSRILLQPLQGVCIMTLSRRLLQVAYIDDVIQRLGDTSHWDQRIIKPSTTFAKGRSISDDDLCSECNRCTYNIGETSYCDINWPCDEGENDYVINCNHYKDRVKIKEANETLKRLVESLQSMDPELRESFNVLCEKQVRQFLHWCDHGVLPDEQS